MKSVRSWNAATRVAFRFWAAYFLVYMLPAPLRLGFFDAVPGGSTLAAPLIHVWKAAVVWIGEAVFRFPATAMSSPSGPEKARDYVQCAIVAVVAASVAFVWSVMDRQSGAYPRLHAWLRVLIRAYLIVALLPFALDKIIPVQFPSPLLGHLSRRVGELTPAALLWTFMGSSTPYQIIGGMAEMSAVILLLFRRTAALGAIVMAAVMSNVVAINFCYDLGVKLYSSHLLAMSLFLIVPQMRALADLFIFHRAAHIEAEPCVFGSRRQLHRIVTGVAAACLVWFGVTTAQDYWSGYKRMLSWRNAPLYGAYDVESAPATIAGAAPWVGIVVQSPTAFAFERADRSAGWYLSAYDAAAHQVALSDPKSKAAIGMLTYSRPDGSHVRLDGSIAGKQVTILLRSADPSRYRLLNHGFHWTHERPPSSE